MKRSGDFLLVQTPFKGDETRSMNLYQKL